jgi:hypothetical protein
MVRCVCVCVCVGFVCVGVCVCVCVCVCVGFVCVGVCRGVCGCGVCVWNNKFYYKAPSCWYFTEWLMLTVLGIQVSQEECANLRESVSDVQIYLYNPIHLYTKLNGYGDNGQRKVWSSCGSTYCTCSADRVTHTLRMPVLESCIAANVRLRYEWLVILRSLPCSLKWRWYTCMHICICHVKCLEP